MGTKMHDHDHSAIAARVMALTAGFSVGTLIPKPVLDELLAQTPKPMTRQRRASKPRIDIMIKRAERAGKNVTSVTTPDGVTLTFGGADKTEADQTNDLDKWMAKRHAN
jgi:hypothetical protein